MDKKAVIAASTLFLSACQSTGGGVTVPSEVGEIQSTTVQICKFVPTVQTVLNLLALAQPGLSGVGQIASAICASVAKEPSGVARAPAPIPAPQIGGVNIQGYFVR